MKLLILLLLSPTYLFAQTNTFGSSDPYRINKLYKNIDQSIKHRQKQIYDLPGTRYGCYYAPDPHDHAKNWSNPPMSDKETQKKIDAGMAVFNQTFNKSLKNNPKLKEQLEGKLAAIKSGGCDKNPNKCLVEIYSTIETYGRFLKPDLNEDYTYKDPSTCGKKPRNRQSRKFSKWADCDLDIRNHNYKVSKKTFYLDAYDKIKEKQMLRGMSSAQAAKDYFNENYDQLQRRGGSRLNLAKSKNGKINKAISSLNGQLQEEQKLVQNKMEVFWNKLANQVNPQKGCAISGKRIAEFPFPKDVALKGFPATGFTTDDNIDDSCFTEEKILVNDFIRTDFEAEVTTLTNDEKENFQKRLDTIIKDKEDNGFDITSVQVIGIASKSWSSLKNDQEAAPKNTKLAKEREDVAKEILANYKSEGVNFSTSHELAGPGYTQTQDKPLQKQKLDDQAIKELYQQLSNDNGHNHLKFVGINNLDSFNSFIKKANNKAKDNNNDHGIENLYDAKYRPFQGFKIVIKGHKSTQVPCDEYGKKKSQSSSIRPKAKAE